MEGRRSALGTDPPMIIEQPAPVGRRRLVVTIVLTVAVAAITNGALAALGFNPPNSQIWPAFAPPGATIGIVWIVLFAGMGAALALAADRRAVVVLILMCLAYPFYTHLFSNHLTELVGNVFTLAYAVWLALRVRFQSPLAAIFIACVAAWIVFATVLVLALARLNGWRI